MGDSEKIMQTIQDKSGKSLKEVEKLVEDKIEELSGLVSQEGALHIIANELGVEIVTTEVKKENVDLVKIDEINQPQVSVSFLCKVLRKYDLVSFSNAKSEGQVQSILVGDETGIIRTTFWNDKVEDLKEVEEGDVLKLVNVYARENQNRIETSYGSYSSFEKNPEGVDIDVKQSPVVDAVDKKAVDLVDGDKSVKISGIVTDFDIPRFYYGCPECFKKVNDQRECPNHGKIESLKIPIVNLSVDDGSGNLLIVGFRNNAERLLNSSSDEIFKLLDNVDSYKNFLKEITGKRVEVVGNVSYNNMTGELQLIANSVLLNEFEPDFSKIFVEGKEDGVDDLKSKEGVDVASKDNASSDEIDLDEIDIDDI